MMLITQSVELESNNDYAVKLINDLKHWFDDNKFANGFDWDLQQFWAKLPDDDCLAFCLKHPEHSDKFRKA